MQAKDWRPSRVSIEDRKEGILCVYLNTDDFTEERFDEMEATNGWVGFFDAEDGRGPYVQYKID